MIQEVLQLQIVKLGTALAKCHFTLFFFLFTPFSKLLPLISVGDRILGLPDWPSLQEKEKIRVLIFKRKEQHYLCNSRIQCKNCQMNGCLYEVPG